MSTEEVRTGGQEEEGQGGEGPAGPESPGAGAASPAAGTVGVDWAGRPPSGPPLSSVFKRLRITGSRAETVTATMEIVDPREPSRLLFRAALTIEAGIIPDGVEIIGVRLDFVDRRPREPLTVNSRSE